MAQPIGKMKEDQISAEEHLLNERYIIQKFIAPLTQTQLLELNCDEDAAVLDFPAGKQLVITTDAVIEGTHFLTSDPPETIARKALRVNLSDLAAMGAHPIGYTLCITFGHTVSFDWLERFFQSLSQENQNHRVSLLGGDTNKSEGPTNISITAFGSVAESKAITRAGAQSGDRIYVTGTIGDAAVGLKILMGEYGHLSDIDKTYLCGRYRVPTSRHVIAQHLGETVHSATDISDGLLLDMNLICEASDLQALIRLDKIPISNAMKNLMATVEGQELKAIQELICSGGDDYELIFTASPGESDHIDYLSQRYAVPITCIGHLGVKSDDVLNDTGHRIKLMDGEGQEIKITHLGYEHQW